MISLLVIYVDDFPLLFKSISEILTSLYILQLKCSRGRGALSSLAFSNVLTSSGVSHPILSVDQSLDYLSVNSRGQETADSIEGNGNSSSLSQSVINKTAEAHKDYLKDVSHNVQLSSF